MTTTQCFLNSKFGIALVIATVCLLASGRVSHAQLIGPSDPPCDVAEPVVLYYAGCELEPQAASPPWCTLADCAPNGADYGQIVVEGGVHYLRINDNNLDDQGNQADLRAYYCRQEVFDADCNGEQEAVFEFAGYGISADTTPPHHIDFYVVVGLRDGFKTITLAIATTGVGFTQPDGNGQNWIPGGVKLEDQDFQTDVDHAYRVEKHVPEGEAAQVLLFVDDELVVTLAYSALTSISENRALIFTSLPGISDAYMEYFRYRIGTTSLRTGPDCDADLDNNGSVSTNDLLILFANWGPCADCNDCIADIDDTCNSDCEVNTMDLLFLLASWGDCS